jgi:hypothetical protein
MGGGSAFGDFLFVTLANGNLIKIDSIGTVSSCLSGLSAPKGLAFGPGGASRTTVLYVAESTTNKISRVDPTCAIGSFAAIGLTAPTALVMGQTAPWGPLETTLYVVNAGTRVDRVDKNGNVTAFVAGLTQADSLVFDAFAPQGDRFGGNLRITDTAAGTILDVFAIRPFLNMQLSGCNPCTPGQTFAVSLTLTNNGPLAVPVELKTGFRLLDATPVSVAPVPKHFDATLPARFTTGQLLWLSFPWPALPAGRYCYEASLADPELAGYGTYSLIRQCFVAQP